MKLYPEKLKETIQEYWLGLRWIHFEPLEVQNDAFWSRKSGTANLLLVKMWCYLELSTDAGGFLLLLQAEKGLVVAVLLQSKANDKLERPWVQQTLKSRHVSEKGKWPLHKSTVHKKLCCRYEITRKLSALYITLYTYLYIYIYIYIYIYDCPVAWLTLGMICFCLVCLFFLGKEDERRRAMSEEQRGHGCGCERMERRKLVGQWAFLMRCESMGWQPAPGRWDE